MEITGTIKQIDETKSFGSNGFRKREVVVSTTEDYPQHILIEFVQDKCDILDNYTEGQSVKVSINLRGREWINPQGEAKYFNSIQGWRIEKLQPAADTGQQIPPPQAPNSYDSFEPATNYKEEDHDDLPF